MDDQGILNFLCELHLFCPHFIYLPRIQMAVKEFRNMWNNYRLSTEGGQTPLQLWHTGIVLVLLDTTTQLYRVCETDDH